MIPVFLVNLDRSPERLERMQFEFFSRGVTQFERVSAVDFSRPTEESRSDLDSMPSWGPWGPVTGHAKGCTLSHFKAYRAFLATQHPYAAIFEDDVFLSDDISWWLRSYDWIPKGADILKIERWRDDRLLVAVARRGSEWMGRKVIRFYSKHSGSAGYIIARSAAESALRAHPIDVPIDHFLFHPNVSHFSKSLLKYQVQPALCQQGNDGVVRQPNPGPRPAKSIRLKLTRGLAELKSLPILGPRLISGEATLEAMKWASTAPNQEPFGDA